MGGVLRTLDINLPPKELVVKKPKRSISMSDLDIKKISSSFVYTRTLSNSHIYNCIPSGHWKGRRCFIVGGGPSLKGFDFNKLKGELVITVNRSFESFPDSAINVAQDARVFGFYENREFPEGEEARKRFNSYEGYKLWVDVQQFPFPEDIFRMPVCHVSDFNWKDFNGGIPPYGNSGLNALCIAVCLGASPIYLLGFDCKRGKENEGNYHSGYPSSNTSPSVYEGFLDDFKEASYYIKQYSRVVNLNRGSAIPSFEFGDIEEVKSIKRPQYISFYTKNTAYQLEKDRLKNTARALGIIVDFYEQENLGTWRANIHDRIRILRHFLDKYKGQDIVYIDCDAEIVKYPSLFDNWNKGDLGIHKLDRRKYFKRWNEYWQEEYEYLGGTMFFKNNDITKQLLELWEEMDKPMNTALSQMTLIYAIRKMQEKGLKVYELPANYCQIFDVMADAGEPVIEHFQASRRGVLNLRMKDYHDGKN